MSMEALAEQPTDQYQHFEESLQPLAMAIPEITADAESRFRAAEFIGRVALNEGRPEDSEALAVKPIESLHQAIREAADGDPEARKMVEMNVRTDVIERTMKSGHVIKVDLMVDEAGTIQQHGQSMQSVQANSLRFAADSPEMRERVEAETTNLFRFQQHFQEGTLDDYYFVVFSRAADNMAQPDMEEAGFFTETMSCAIQVSTVEDGRLTMESAFVSGIKRPGEERHDGQTLRGVCADLEVDCPDTATDTIDTPYLIHKSKLPNGAIDLVELWDKNVPRDGDGEGIFFGEAKPAQDYLEYLEVCRQREERFEPKVQKITEQLIQEHETIATPVAAVRRLGELSGEQMIEQAFGDTDIDPRVFGAVSADRIIQGRAALEQGRYDEALNHMNVAKANDNSSSCPGVASGTSQSQKGESRSSTDSDECEFISKKCPECGAKNVKTKVTKNKITGSCGCSKSK